MYIMIYTLTVSGDDSIKLHFGNKHNIPCTTWQSNITSCIVYYLIAKNQFIYYLLVCFSSIIMDEELVSVIIKIPLRTNNDIAITTVFARDGVFSIL